MIAKLFSKRKQNNKKIVVFTALYGEYDKIKKINSKNKNVDYFAFTDQFIPEDSGWVLKTCEFPTEIGNDNILKSRYVRMHPHIFFQDYDYAIYVDASIIIEHDLVYLIGRLKKKQIAMYQHPWSKDIYDEANLVIRWKRASEETTKKQIEKYKAEGYPRNFGMTTNNIFVCIPSDKGICKIMDAWWEEFKKPENTKRDQMCLFYVIWKLGFKKTYVGRLGTKVYDDPIIKTTR